MNKVFLIGRITKELELKDVKEHKVCEFTLAVNRDKERTDFINCVVWNKQAENLCKYQHKGNLISVLGSLYVDTFEGKDGKRYKTYIHVNELEYLQNNKKEDISKEQLQSLHFETAFDKNNQFKIDESDYPF